MLKSMNLHNKRSGTTNSGHSGFTLTEMAIVLVIVSLLIGGMIIPLSAQIDYRDVSNTEKTLAEIKEALIGFAVVNRRLPRPAVSAVNGAERVQCANEAACTGFIPWEALGIQKTDAWGKLIRYSVTPGFSGGTTVGTDNPIALTTAPSKIVRTRNSSAAADALLANSMPAVIFSHGKRNFGTDNMGNALPNSALNNADEITNNNGPTTFYSRLISTDTSLPGGEFDDIVTWIPTTVLFNRMISASRLP